jgi:hypothetical protein
MPKEIGNVRKTIGIAILVLLGLYAISKIFSGSDLLNDKNLIFYSILSDRGSKESRYMDILISESATRTEISKLAYALKDYYKMKNGTIFISIFDSKEAWANRSNDNYPPEEYQRHFVAQVTTNQITVDKK